MIIVSKGGETVEIKTKTSTIELSNKKSQVNDVELVGAGEYEIGDVEIRGFQSGAYLIKTEDMVLVYLDGVTSLNQESVEELGDVDVLFVPAKHPDLITTIDPRLVVPIGEGLAEFCKAQSCEAPVKTLKISKKDVEAAERKIIVLNG